MRYYIFSAILIVAAIAIVISIPSIVDLTENSIFSLQVPSNNSQVAGIQKYNIPPVSKNIPIPQFSAKAVFIKDLTSNTILFQKEASIGASVSGAKAGLLPGEDLSFRSLLYAMLLNSGNDAAYSLAENYPGGILGFVSAMNKKAAQLSLQNTHFDNPAGFDSPKNFSSAKDLAVITEEALKNVSLARIFATKQTNIVSLDKKYTHQLANLNKLLSQVRGVMGVKTGYTEGAKENLVTFVDRDGHQILTVVLGSNDRFGESAKIIEWVYSNYQWP